MKAGMDIIKPLMIADRVEMVGKVAIGTVKGDLHDIGKNLVAMMLEGSGFQVINLGTDVAPGGVYGGGGQFFWRGFRACFILPVSRFVETRSKPRKKN